MSGLGVLADHTATPTLARQRRTCFIPLYAVAFLPATTLMPSLSTLRACTQRFPFKFVQESACCSCVCRNLETLRLRFLAFHAGFLLVFFAPFRSWASYDNGLYISLAHFWFSSLPAMLNCYSCRNDLILLDPFLGQLFIPFLSGLSRALFCFYSWAPMSLWASTA